MAKCVPIYRIVEGAQKSRCNGWVELEFNDIKSLYVRKTFMSADGLNPYY